MKTQASTEAARSRLEYTQRMNRVMDHIDRHLDQPLALADLASVANFSSFHFHRIFAAWMGQTLGDYLRRRRLEVGALMLARSPALTVLEVALAVGFGSGEAFARAFKQTFGQSPSAWRAQAPLDRRLPSQSKMDQGQGKLDQAETERPTHDEDSIQQEFLMRVLSEIRVQKLAPVRLAYMRHIGPYGPSVGRFWAETFLPWRAAQGLSEQDCYGIGLDDPAVTRPAQCRYDACVEVPAGFVARNPVSLSELPGGVYAVAQFKGRESDVAAAWTELLREWLPASGMQLDERPFFERYAAQAQKDANTGVFACEICIAVKPL
jgi:AraC family transcriptional regulator